MSETEIRNTLEAALLAAGRSLSLGELSLLFDDTQRVDAAAIRAALQALAQDYAQRAIELQETGAGFRIQVRRQYASAVVRLWPERPQRYSRALLETLALIAYRQPITRAEIEAVRGVAVNPNIIKTLLERQWIRIVGHRDLPGRPELLGTTRDFLDYFSLKSLDELPSLAQLRSFGELESQFELPVAGVSPVVAGAAVIADDAQGGEGAEADGGENGDSGDNVDGADGGGELEDYPVAHRPSGLVAGPPEGLD
jgi:segregation and condensation protein B